MSACVYVCRCECVCALEMAYIATIARWGEKATLLPYVLHTMKAWYQVQISMALTHRTLGSVSSVSFVRTPNSFGESLNVSIRDFVSAMSSFRFSSTTSRTMATLSPW